MKSYSVYFANYTIGEDAYDQVRQVCPAYGKRVLLIGGSKALEAAEELLRDAVKDCELEIVDTVHFGSDCTYAAIDRWAAHAGECKADMIFGMGGGKALDTAKGAAERAGSRCLPSRPSRRPARRRQPFPWCIRKMGILTAFTFLINRQDTALSIPA